FLSRLRDRYPLDRTDAPDRRRFPHRGQFQPQRTTEPGNRRGGLPVHRILGSCQGRGNVVGTLRKAVLCRRIWPHLCERTTRNDFARECDTMRQWLALRTAGLCLAVGLALIAVAVQAQSVRVTVNGTPITDQQINDRANLLRIEGQGGSNSNRIQLATEQLIDDQIKLDEA